MNHYPLALFLALGISTTVRGQDWEPIFNGKDLTGWEGSVHWTAKDSVITGEVTKDNLIKANTFLIWKAGTVANFEFKCKFRMERGNSGIQYRSVHLDKEKADAYVVKGYQADIAFGQYMGILYEERGRGILAYPGQKVVIDANGKPQDVGGKEVVDDKGKKRTIGVLGDDLLRDFDLRKWHEYRIVAKGNHLQQFIDGKPMLDVVDHDTKRRKMEGILALQLHVGGPMFVQFKELELKRLPDGGIIDP